MKKITSMLLVCLMLLAVLPVSAFAQTEEVSLVEETLDLEEVITDESVEEDVVSEEELATWDSLKNSFSNLSSASTDQDEADNAFGTFWEETKEIFERYLQELLHLFDE